MKVNIDISYKVRTTRSRMERTTRKRKQVDYSYSKTYAGLDDEDDHGHDDNTAKSSKTKKAAATAKKSTPKKKAPRPDDFSEDDEFGFEASTEKGKSAPPKRLSMQEKREQAELNRALALSKKESRQNTENHDPSGEEDDGPTSRDQALITNFTKTKTKAAVQTKDDIELLSSPDVVVDLSNVRDVRKPGPTESRDGGANDDDEGEHEVPLKKSTEVAAKAKPKSKSRTSKTTDESDADIVSDSELSVVSENESDDDDDYGGRKKKKPPPKKKAPALVPKKADAKPKAAATRGKRKSDEMAGNMGKEGASGEATDQPSGKRTRPRGGGGGGSGAAPLANDAAEEVTSPFHPPNPISRHIIQTVNLNTSRQTRGTRTRQATANADHHRSTTIRNVASVLQLVYFVRYTKVINSI
ncbi:hypothetical protein HDV00_011424 [Rhizophlyctis rosea]|nr:hypothetical protein HDV00_011424 [Rhizophlyctis rosea]